MASIASDDVIQQYVDGTLRLTFTDLHIHTEYSLQDGMIRVADAKDPKKVKKDIVLNAERRNTGAVTATDHDHLPESPSAGKEYKTAAFPKFNSVAALGRRRPVSLASGGINAIFVSHTCGDGSLRVGRGIPTRSDRGQSRLRVRDRQLGLGHLWRRPGFVQC
jgi:hypothetical protein